MIPIISRSRKLFACCCCNNRIYGLFPTFIGVLTLPVDYAKNFKKCEGLFWKKLVDLNESDILHYSYLSHVSMIELDQDLYMFGFEERKQYCRGIIL